MILTLEGLKKQLNNSDIQLNNQDTIKFSNLVNSLNTLYLYGYLQDKAYNKALEGISHDLEKVINKIKREV